MCCINLDKIYLLLKGFTRMVKNNFLITLILGILSIAYVLVDWSIGFINFADVLVLIDAGIILTIGLITKTLYVQKNQILLFLGLVIIVLLNILLNLLLNPNFSSNESIISLFKVICYSVAFVLIYNFIVGNNLEYKFFRVVSVITVIVCFLGMYITLAINVKGVLPYEFFWSFTRDDLASYMYRGYSSIIRTRSLFSEPAHFGYYLNSVLAIMYFNNQNYKPSPKIDIIITVSIILTLSYSSIIILLLVKVLRYSNFAAISNFLHTGTRILPMLIGILILSITIGDSIQEAILDRTQEIINGEDSSTESRIEGSWNYITEEAILIGNGIGNTPTIFNNFAYILSDLGLISTIFYLIFNLIFLRLNFRLEVVFIALNIQKGGYLGVGFWILVLLMIIYTRESEGEMYNSEHFKEKSIYW